MGIKITFEVETTEQALALLSVVHGQGVPSVEMTAPAVATPSPTGPASGSEIKASASVVAYAEENDVDLTEVEGTGKNGRITKADVTAAIKAAAVPEPEPEEPEEEEEEEDDEDDIFGADDDEEDELVTKDTVRAALIEYQTKLKAKYAKKMDDADAGKRAQQKARKLLSNYAETLRALEESKYTEVVAAAKKAIKEL